MVVMRTIKKYFSNHFVFEETKKLMKRLYATKKKTTLNAIFFFDLAKKI